MNSVDFLIILAIVVFMFGNFLFAYHGLNGSLGEGIRRFLMCITDYPKLE